MSPSASDSFPRLTADEAAGFITDTATVGFSGFTAAGAAKAVPRALARRAKAMHAKGDAMQIWVLTGASTGAGIDDALAEADAIAWRSPYQSSAALRNRINTGHATFVDTHLSHVPQMVETGFYGDIDFAVIEAVDLTRDGRVYLSTSVGASPSYLRHAQKVIIERNAHHSQRVWEMHDIAILPRPPYRGTFGITQPLERMGTPFAAVDPDKIIGVVETDEPDGIAPYPAPSPEYQRIAAHVARFLVEEQRRGRIPEGFLPLQAGGGKVASAVLPELARNQDIPPFTMYTEVFQDPMIELMAQGRLVGASATCLALSEPELQRLYADMDYFAPRIVLRPQELSNNPGVVRQLGVIAIDAVLEVDIYGHANSSHIAGTTLVNGIGGAGDFVRNAYLSILVTPSLAKGGRISTIVPMATHCDHSEHSVQVVVTEQGLADLRGLGPIERARTVIDHCAHPMYREYLHRYLREAPMGHIRHDLKHCFGLHTNLLQTGMMLPE